MAKLARSIARSGGQRQAARQVAFALSTEPFTIRRDVCAVIAALANRGEDDLPLVGDVLRDLDRLPKIEAPTRRRARPRTDRRDPLPVDAARAVALDVVAERLGLVVHRRGRAVVALCPFHDDTHPSLDLDLRKAVWFCHVCQVGGDGIELMMKKKGITFADAVREVAA